MVFRPQALTLQITTHQRENVENLQLRLFLELEPVMFNIFKVQAPPSAVDEIDGDVGKKGSQRGGYT